MDKLSKEDNPLKTYNVLLLDERSISNTEMFSQVIKHYKLATIIGRPTVGPMEIEMILPYSMNFRSLLPV